MAGRRARTGTRSMEELIRLACSADPEVPVSRPRRLALAPRVAMVTGAALLVLAVVLAVRSLALAPDGGHPAGSLGAGAPPSVPAGSLDQGSATGGTGSGRAPGAPGVIGPEAQATAGLDIVVHVTGAVSSPGVVTLPAGSRVADAIEAAGSALEDADTSLINLARILVDGEQMCVPYQGEQVPDTGAGAAGTVDGSGGTSSGGAEGAADSSAGGLVNINTADAAALETLPGIGPALAQRIVEHREAHGPFAAVDDLTDVPGVGPAKLKALRAEASV